MTKATSSDKEIPSKATTSSSQVKVGRKNHTGATSTDLRSMLTSLLMENQSKCISLKKAVGDTFPNSAKQIEPIMKKIAIYQASGRYFLKPEMDTESFPKPAPESGSSPEDHCQPSSAPDKFDQLPAPQPVLPPKTDSSELEEGAVSDSKPQEASDAIEQIDIVRLSPDRSEGQANSSSDSGSDSDSESSDSGSDSGSQSRSRSRSKSVASGSSSDSESDASSNSKEASDEDVDIMSDDDKETNHKLRASEQLQCGTLDFEPGQVEVGEREDLNVADIVEIEDLPDSGQVVEMAVIPDSGPMRDDEKPVQEIRPLSSDWHEHKQSQVQRGKLPHETENVGYQNHSSEIERVGKDSFNHELSSSVQKSQKGKSKRARDEIRLVDKGDKNKRVKTQNAIQQQNSGARNSTFVESSHLSPDKPSEGPYKGVRMQMEDRTSGDAAGDFCSQNSYNHTISRKSASEFLQPDRRSADFTARGKTPSGSERSIKQGESSGSTTKYTERSLQMNERFSSQRDKVSRGSQDVYGIVSDKREGKISKDGVGDQQRTSVDSNLNKYNSPLPGNSPKDYMGNTGKSSFMNGRGRMLHRELSDLELGELREPPPQETAVLKKQVEKKSSFKGENRPSSSDYWNFEPCKGRAADKTVADFKRSSPLQSSSVPSGAPDGLSKRKTPEWNAEDFSRPHQKVAQPQPQHPRPRINQNNIGSQYNQPVEVHSIRQIEEGSLATGQEVHADNRRKSSSGVRERDLKHSVLPPSVKQNKGQKSSLAAEINDRHKDASFLGSYEGHQRMRESSPDEMSSYSKYEKEEPELKGPIENYAQYEEYVQEYQEKYDNYCSINKTLESYRKEFRKLGKELEVSRGRDTQRFYDMLRQLKDSYRKCGPRHKRLKKIFIVLHDELKHLKQMIKDSALSYARDR